MEEDARYLKKKIKPGVIDVHPNENTIIINFEVEATILGDAGIAMLGENKSCQKAIKIKNLNSNTDIKNLSQLIVEKCSLLHPTKLPELEQLLFYMQTRKVAINSASVEQEMERIRKQATQFDDIDEIQEKADINELESYIDLLYDDMKTKVKGTSLILQLARNPDNLAELVDNEMLLGALSRVLREDWKKSIDLCTNIIYIFFCFSSFSTFHTVLFQYKIGSTCLQIIENELKRFEFWTEELDKKKQVAIKEKTEEAQKSYKKSEKKFELVIHKQEQLLRVAVYLLLNMAEDAEIEFKMTQKDVVHLLVSMLSRKSLELLILVVSFLKRLSVYKENKDAMKEIKIIAKLSHLIPNESDILVSIVLRFLLNLSFDADIRKDIIKAGMLPKIVAYIGDEAHRVFALCILYHISVDDRLKPLFSYTDIVPIVIHILQDNEEGQLDMELMALCVNLTTNAKIATHFAHDLRMLLRQSLKNKDSLMLKMVRNILAHDVPEKKQILGSLNEIVSLMKSNDHDEVVVELVAVLAELNLPEIDFLQLVNTYDLVPWICGNLTPANNVANDIVLEVVRFVGNVVRNSECAQLFAEAGLPHTLIDLITAKQEDDEIVLQILYVFYQMIFHKSTRDKLIKESQAPAYLIDLMHDKNTEVRKMCDTTLDIISEYDEEWATKIQYEKFKWHNSQWLEMVTQGLEPEVASCDDDYLPRDMMMAGDSTADLLFQHEQALRYSRPPYIMDGEYYDGENMSDYEGEDELHPSYFGGPNASLNEYMEYERDMSFYARQGFGMQHHQDQPGYSNLDGFTRTLENWHLNR